MKKKLIVGIVLIGIFGALFVLKFYPGARNGNQREAAIPVFHFNKRINSVNDCQASVRNNMEGIKGNLSKIAGHDPTMEKKRVEEVEEVSCKRETIDVELGKEMEVFSVTLSGGTAEDLECSKERPGDTGLKCLQNESYEECFKRDCRERGGKVTTETVNITYTLYIPQNKTTLLCS